MNERLQIIIQAGLDEANAIKNINKELKQIGKSLESIDLKINIDKNFTKQLTDFSKQFQNFNKQIGNQIDLNDKLQNSFDGNVNSLNKQAKAFERMAEAERKWAIEQERINKKGITTSIYGNNLDNNKQIVKTTADGGILSQEYVNNYKKNAQDLDKVVEQMYQGRVKAEEKTQKLDRQALDNQQKQIAQNLENERKRVEELDKIHTLALQQNRKRNDDYRQSMELLNANIDDRIRRFGADKSVEESLRRLKTELADVRNIGNFKTALKDVDIEMRKIISTADTAGSRIDRFGEQVRTAFERFPIWMITGGITYGALNGVKEMVNAIIEIDSQMTQLQRVMNDNTDFEGMLSDSIDLANELGRSLTDVNNAKIEFGRMGYNADQINELARTASLMQNVSETSSSEAVDALVSAMTNFNIEAEKSISIVDALNEVDNSYAVTTQDLAISLNKAAATGSTFGATMHEIVGHTTAVTEATRESGSIVGNFLKTIYSRLTTMDKSEGTLQAVGVAMRDVSGETRNVNDILTDLANNWDNLSKSQQEYTGKALAGQWQLGRFLALMQNWDTAVAATETALNSQGSAMRENEKYMDSLAARIEKLKVAGQTLSVSIGNAVISDSIVVLTTQLANFTNVIAGVVEHTGALPLLFGTVYAGLTATSAGFRMFSVSIKQSIIDMFGLTASANTATKGIWGLNAALKAAGISWKTFAVSTGIGVGFMAVGGIIEWLISKFADATEATDNLSSSFDQLNAKQIELTNIQKLSEEYETLTSKAELTAEEKMKLANVESELANQHGIVMKSMDDQTNAVDINTQAIIDRTNALRDEIKAEQEKAQNDYRSNASDINDEIEKRKKTTEEAAETYEQASAKQREFLDNLASGTRMSNKDDQWSTNLPEMIVLDPNSEKHVENIEALGEELAKAVQNAKEKFDKENNAFVKSVTVKEKALQNVFSSYVDAQQNEGKKIKELTRTFSDLFASVQARSGNSETDSLKLFEDVFNTIQSADVSNLQEAVTLMESLPGATSLNAEEFAVLRTELAALNFDGVSTDAEGLETTLSDTEDTVISLTEAIALLDNGFSTSGQVDLYAKAIEAANGEVELLTKAEIELQKENKLSSSTIKELNGTYGDFIDVVGLSNEEIAKFLNSKKAEKVEFINAEIEKTDTAISETKARIKALEIETNELEKVRKKRAEIKLAELSQQVAAGEISEQLAEKQLAAINRYDADEQLDLSLAIAQLDNLTRKRSMLSNVQSEFNQVVSDTVESNRKAEESAKSSNDTTKETTETLTALQKKLQEVNDELAKVESTQSKYAKSSQEHRRALGAEISLLEKKKKLLEEGVKDPSKLISTKTTYTTTSTSSGGSVLSAGSSKQVTGDYSDYINKYAAQEGIDPALVKAVAMQESTLGKASNNVMQVNGMSNSTPEESIKKGTQMLADLLKKTNGDINKALSAYNMGPGVLNYFNKNGGYSVENMQGFSNYQKNKHGYRIYGDPDYVNHVLRYYDNATTTASTTSTKSTPKTEVSVSKPSQIDLDQEKQKAIQEQLEIDKEIYANRISVIESYSAEYEMELSKQDAALAKSERGQAKYNKNSEEWRKAEADQIGTITDKQNTLHQEAETIRTLMSKWGIESDELTQQISRLGQEWNALAEEKKAKEFEIIISRLDEYNDQVNNIGHTLDFSSAKLSAMVEGSEAYRKELAKQIPLMEEQQELKHQEAEQIRQDLKNDKLSAERKAELSQRLATLTIEWWNLESSIKSTHKTLLSFTNEALTSLFDTLKTSLDSNEIFDFDAFNDSIDSIISQLDMIDGKYENGVQFVDTTSQSRSDLASYASQVKGIAQDVKQALNYTNDLSNVNFGNMNSLSNQIKHQINLVAQLKNQIADIDNQIRDTELRYSREEAALEQQIKNTEKYYDTQIKKQQEVLDNLDEQYEKEDRIKRLQELNDEINKVKNDKRFSYITEAGEEILTYDKGRLEELEKQKDELVEQYEREDVKQAIQDEIDRLQDAKDREVEIQQEALEKTKQIHQQNLEAMRLYQSSLNSLYSQTVTDTQNKMDQFEEALRKGLEDGTLSVEEGSKLLEMVVDGWQASSLTKWDVYISQVASKLAELQSIYASMASLASSMGSVGGSSGGGSGSSSGSSAALEAAKEAAKNQTNSQAAKDYIDGLVGIDGGSISQDTLDAIEYNTNWRANRKYHTGGTVGEKPLQAGEYPTVLKIGEHVWTEEHMKELTNKLDIGARMTSSLMNNNFTKFITDKKDSSPTPTVNETNYHLHDVTVKANNPTEFYKSIKTQVNSTKR